MKKLSLLFKVITLIILNFLTFSSFAQTQSFPANRTYPNGVMASNRNGQDAVNSYNTWKTNFLETCSNGRYRVKFDSPSQTVSEGVAYGMLLTAYAGDQTIFNGLWNYYKDNRNGNGVMNWKINGCSGVIGSNGATDAEIDAAMALIVADYQWGSSGTINYGADARTLIGIMKSKEVESDTFVLKPGDAFGGSNLTNPSYFAPGYFRKFASYTNDNFWIDVANKSYDIINKNLSVNNAAGGIVSDWCTASGSYSNEAGGYRDGGRTYSYDAARTPWRIATDYVWYGNASAKTYSKKSSDFVRVTIGGTQNVVDGYNQNGTKSGQYHNATFVGAFACAAMGGENTTHLDNSYADLKSLNEPNSYFNHTLKTLYLFLLSGNFYLPGETVINPPVAVTGVSISPTSVNLNTGQTRQLTPTVSPSNATNKSVTYSTSNAGVASVNASGLVTAVAAGNATITVRTVDGGKTATATIAVTTVTNPIAVTSVSISPTTVNLNTGQTSQLTPTVSPSNATNKSVTYSSSNTGVASINSSGLVTAVAAGNATITVKTVDGNKTATAAITVTTSSTSCSFGAPINTSLPSVNSNYNKMYVFGTGGPNISNFREFQINWDLANNGLYVFAYSTKNGVPGYYNDLKGKITHNFNAAKPSVTITNSGISGLDGAYWVTKKGSDFVLVHKTQGFTLYFSNAASAPACSNAREGESPALADTSTFTLYPNPTKGLVTINDVSANSTIRVIDLQGKVLLEKETTKDDAATLDLNGFKAGIYSLQISTNTGTTSQKLIVQQ